MTNLIEQFNIDQAAKINEQRGGLEKFIPDFNVGDTIKVQYRISEGGNSRIQVFAGVVIARTKSFSNYNSTFTVRKISSGVGVERKFPLYSPFIAGIEVAKQGVVRRAKLYYLRNLTGKASRIKEKLDFSKSPKSKGSKNPKISENKTPKESE
ncbi:MAG: large subunit ribosomal protein L19 [Lentimonas sp.]|jgi:large subunit ribosomal protein L19